MAMMTLKQTWRLVWTVSSLLAGPAKITREPTNVRLSVEMALSLGMKSAIFLRMRTVPLDALNARKINSLIAKTKK